MMKTPQNKPRQVDTEQRFRSYDAETETAMKRFYDSLSEKDRRRYAGIEALKLGHGGQKYIARILGCSRNTVKKGASEVSDLPPQEVDKRIRQPGGGRRKYSEKWVSIDEQFLAVVKEHTAGDPMEERVIWTDLNVGTSSDTSEFACDSLRYWWLTYGSKLYPVTSSLLILCDGGGSNSSRHYIFKFDVQQLADELGIEIWIAHYSPYCFKHNPIEHRLFPHVTHACQGVIFTSIELVIELMSKTNTKIGLKAFVHIIDKVYATKRKVCEAFKDNLPIVFDDFLPNWNYRAVPRLAMEYA